MIKYIARQKKDPIKGVSKFYAQIATVEPVSLHEIAVKISTGCTVSVHDIKAVISSLQGRLSMPCATARASDWATSAPSAPPSWPSPRRWRKTSRAET